MVLFVVFRFFFWFGWVLVPFFSLLVFQLVYLGVFFFFFFLDQRARVYGDHSCGGVLVGWVWLDLVLIGWRFCL